MKSILIILTSILFYTVILGQSNCFEDCHENLKRPSFTPLNKKAEVVMQGLVGCKFPDFTFKSIDGKAYSLNELSGKVVVINFYFASCNPCIAEIPALNKLALEYKNKDVLFLAFTSDLKTKAFEFKKKHSFQYEIVSELTELEIKFCLFQGEPTNMVLDKKGIVRQIFAGGLIDENAKTHAYLKIKPIIDKYL